MIMRETIHDVQMGDGCIDQGPEFGVEFSLLQLSNSIWEKSIR